MTGRKNYISGKTGKSVSRQANYFTKRYAEMNYSLHRDKPVVLARGKYMGYPFIVVDLGTHPTAYVCLPKDHALYEVKWPNDAGGALNIHGGGFTFAEKTIRLSTIKDRWWVGWDYAHLSRGDYFEGGFEEGFLDSMGATHKWTTDEIIEEVKDVIKQLTEFDKKILK